MQASFIAEEWVDHALSKSRDAKGKLAHSEKAQAEAKKKYKESLFTWLRSKKGAKMLRLPW